ncbi:MAG: 2-C-methyl-D-erythritol 2,4-cyclodiphosphate synthase [Clostridia bacterium]|nr:2-C-methyl-D-erythritol 2,4-cyclodiphosphate synthase [Clostridia bacterium]
MRVGIGYDVHPLVKDRPLVLGGITLDYHLGLAGHSDADVLLHALADALLGAAGLGDIGRHFPPGDSRYRGISSLILLEEVSRKVKDKGFQINNVDVVVVAEKPKLTPYFPAMQENIARVLQLSPERINLKATTSEGLGFTGRGEGIAAWAVVSLI